MAREVWDGGGDLMDKSAFGAIVWCALLAFILAMTSTVKSCILEKAQIERGAKVEVTP